MCITLTYYTAKLHIRFILCLHSLVLQLLFHTKKIIQRLLIIHCLQENKPHSLAQKKKHTSLLCVATICSLHKRKEAVSSVTSM